MLHVLRTYLPIRKAILIASELVILTVLVAMGTSSHLWGRMSEFTQHAIALEGLSPGDARWRCAISALMVSVLAQIAIAFNELYDFRISASRFDRAARFLGSAGSAILIVLAAVGLVQVWDIDRILDFPGLPFTQRLVVLVTTLLMGFGLLYVWRNLFHFLLRRYSFNERLLVVGTGKAAKRLVEELQARDGSGYEVVGMIAPPVVERRGGPQDRRRSDDGAAEETTPAGPGLFGGGARAAAPLRTVGTPAPQPATTLLLATDVKEALESTPEETPSTRVVEESLLDLARQLDIDEIVVALENRRGALPTDELLRCRLNGLRVEEAESLYERVTGKIAVEAMRPSYLIFNPGFVQHPLSAFAKRIVDIALALLVFAFTWPLMILTALAIRLDSPGPVLFRQVRTGLQGESFTLLKFRSMRQDAEKATGPVWATEDDPRITKVGKFLRRTRLDELPQLFNVLGGSMSMIGPRPERPTFVEELAEQIPYFHQRHIVKPGLTGWAQINYPYGNTLEDASQKLQYDLFYIKYHSLLFDLSILFYTIKTVVLRKGT